jgi:predicted enzyme related to lactoylglutathione lyase
MTSRFHRSPSVGLYCIELRSAHWEQAVLWYREVLGLRVLVRVPEDGYALFEAGETRLAILARHAPGDASPRWSLGFEVDSLEAVIGRLRATGAKIAHPHGNAEGFHEVMTEDPDGNHIRLFAWPERG